MNTISNRVVGSALLFVISQTFTAYHASARSVPEPMTSQESPTETPNQIRTHDANRVRLPVTNLGVLGDITGSQPLWNGVSFLYYGSLWIGAITEEERPLVSSGIPSEFLPSSGPAGELRESGEGVTGGGRAGINGIGDDDRDGIADEDRLNGLDDDGDGRIDEDYDAAGAQMFTSEYRDDEVPVDYHEPLGLRVRQRSMAWNSSKTLDFVGIEYEISNVGDQRLTSVYAGLHLEFDVGPPEHERYWSDDLAGFTTVDVPGPITGNCPARSSPLDILYAWDAADNGTTIAGGDTPGYIGVVFLGYTADKLATGFYGEGGVPQPGRMTSANWAYSCQACSDPRTDGERYSVMSSRRIPGRNTVRPEDYRLYASSGPFPRLDPGDQITLAIGLVLGNGYDDMVANAIAAKRAYDGFFIDGDQDPRTGADGRETCIRAHIPPADVYWDNPCDSPVDYVVPKFDPCFWIDADCDSCTGVGGREALLHWVGAAPPPLPASNVDPGLYLPSPGVEIYAEPAAGDARVTLQWDNASELSGDPISGNYLFEGYRVWRADAYAGRGDQAPPEEEWGIVAEFRRNSPPDSPVRCDHCESFDSIEHQERDTIRRLTSFGPHYFIGRYEWHDAVGILNGKVYYYAVTAFGTTTLVHPDSTEVVEVATSPVISAQRIVVPQWAAGSGCASVKVVPNPYHGDAEWDLTPSDCDPSGRKIAFRSLPEGWTSLHIYTLAGDLVLSAGPEDSRVVGGCETSGTTNPGGTFFWDLIGDGGRQVTSGVYLYTMESPGERCRGRFVIIR